MTPDQPGFFNNDRFKRAITTGSAAGFYGRDGINHS
jgi:hypothetical protein